MRPLKRSPCIRRFKDRRTSSVLPSRMLHGNAGHFGDVRESVLERWRALGEAGQLIAGIKAGYSPDEVAIKREWTEAELKQYVLEAAAYMQEERRRLAARGSRDLG